MHQHFFSAPSQLWNLHGSDVAMPVQGNGAVIDNLKLRRQRIAPTLRGA
jgi:hypothetical protein